MKKIRINDLHKGDRVRLVNFGNTNLIYRQRLLSLGITRGVEIKIIRVAPLGCPLQIEIRGTSLTLRKEEAAELEWESV
ncbi:FeoA family protein [Legionella sp. CNM-1927-20]|uniref:FeoA family protein n=1 Tax=Legionella sp. CNM-1927-20 TaxID=3422221 RepID=UPI00403B1F56